MKLGGLGPALAAKVALCLQEASKALKVAPRKSQPESQLLEVQGVLKVAKVADLKALVKNLRKMDEKGVRALQKN